MNRNITVQGRRVTAADLQEIGQLINTHGQWTRWRLSRELAAAWDWRNGAGQLKDMAARSLLLKLQERGLIQLPARRRLACRRMGRTLPSPAPWDTTRIECGLGELAPLQIREVSSEAAGRRLFSNALSQFHYLGYRGSVGENLQYLVLDKKERLLALGLWNAAAWKCRARDQWIGWEAEQRERHLAQLANNSRFLILPWVRVPHLASWILGQLTRRLAADWQAKYGHPIALVESFVEQDRFRGTAYQAANWIKVGATAGRTRQDRFNTLRVPIKAIYLYPLRRDFREVLCV